MKIKKLNIIFILVIIAVVGLMTHTAIRYNNAEKKEAQYKKEKVWKQNFYEKKWEREHTQADSFLIDSVESA
jgi:sortase (surface protein transpeptidase)